MDTKEFELTEDSLLFHPAVWFQWLKDEDAVIKYVQLDKFIKDDDKQRFLRFLDLIKDGESFYVWSYDAPLAGRGGVCIFRNNRPIYAYLTWLS